MKKLTRLLVLVLGMCLLVPQAMAEEKVTLTALVAKYPIVGDWNTNPAAMLLSERTGVDVQWEVVADASFLEKRNLLFGSNDLPDIIMRAKLSATDEAKYAANGQLYPLDTLLEYAPNFSALMEQFPAIAKNITSPDGHIYSLPQLNTTEGNLVDKYWINQTWLDKLGLEMPRTTDELTEVLRAFVNNDPNGNGQKDELGFSFQTKTYLYDGLNRFYGAFGMGKNHGIISGYFQVNDEGKVELAAATDNYRQMLTWLNQLWTEGLIDKDSFSQDFSSVAAKAALDQVGFTSYGNNYQWLGSAKTNFVQPEIIAGPNGDAGWTTMRGFVQNTGTACITTACKNPEAAMRYLDYYYSEAGTVAIRMGIEGESYYVDENGAYQLYDHIKHDPTGLSLDEAIAKYGLYCGGNVPQYITDAVDQSAAQLPETKEANEKLRPGMLDFNDIVNLHFTEDEVIAMSRYEVDLIGYVEENLVNFITGERDLAEFDAYVQELNRMDLEGCLEIYQAAFDRWNAI